MQCVQQNFWTKNDTFNWFKDIQDDVVYLPIMWLDEGISGPSKVRFIL